MGISLNKRRNDIGELLKAIPPEKMNLVFTSPPFFPPAERHDRRAAEEGRKRRGKDARKPRSARTAKGAG